MNSKLLTKQHFEFLTLKGGYTGSSKSTYAKIPHCWKSHVVAQCFRGDTHKMLVRIANRKDNNQTDLPEAVCQGLLGRQLVYIKPLMLLKGDVTSLVRVCATECVLSSAAIVYIVQCGDLNGF